MKDVALVSNKLKDGKEIENNVASPASDWDYSPGWEKILLPSKLRFPY